MAVLEGIEPEPVFRYFEKICEIPHGSGNTKALSDFCVRFAKQRSLRCIQDEMNNVIIFKQGTAGYEASAPVILQGHLDMVCEKTPDCDIDFEREGLSLRVEDGFLSAEGTTLGGDDGIAVAYALAILDSDTIPHPPLEVVFTVDEEVGMLGAAGIDCTPLKGRTMLNIDSEEEGILLVSCAGGVCVDCHLPVSREEAEGIGVKLTLDGLTGGHSGVEIHKGRSNANQLLGRVLNEVQKEIPFSLISVCGGKKDNAIPRVAEAEMAVASGDLPALELLIERQSDILRKERSTVDEGLSLTMIAGESGRFRAMDTSSVRRVIAALLNLPGGVQRMSADIPGLVQTSLNMGILSAGEEEVNMCFSVRSSVGTEKEALVSRLANFMELVGGSIDCSGDYPAWEYRRDSALRERLTEIFERQYGRKPEVQAVHAGLECGLFAGKLPGLDCVSLGPDMTDIHTTGERMDLDSVRRTWDYLCEILRSLK